MATNLPISKFSGLSLNLFYFNVSAVLMTQFSKTFHTCSELSTSQILPITLDEIFPIFIYPKYFYLLLFIPYLLLLSSLCSELPI